MIGISGYGRVYLQLALDYHRRGDLRLVAAVVINPDEETAAVADLRALGCEIFADYPTMLERHRGALDLCLIPTGIGWHTRMTLAALSAGANVLVEKPLASSMTEVKSIAAAAQQANRFVAVGFQDYYDPATQWLKRQLLAGVIGTVRSVRFLGLWPRSRSYFSRNDWAGRLVVDGVPVYDSPLNNAFAHFVNLSLFFAAAGEEDAAEVRVESTELLRAHDIENFDTAVVRLRTSDDVAVWLGATHACGRNREPEIVIEGTHGSVTWRHEHDVRIFRDGVPGPDHKVADAFTARHAMLTAVLARLSDATAVVCGPRIAGRHTALIEALAEAADIRTVPATMIDWQSNNGPAGAVPVVRGLEAALQRAFEQGETLAGSGFQLSDSAEAAVER